MTKFTHNWKKKCMDLVMTDITGNTNFYYCFVAKHSEWSDDESPDLETLSDKVSHYDIHAEMMLGKKIKVSDVTYMIRRIDWATNTAYSMYDHRSSNLFSSDFYVINSSNDVFKCIFNNSNGYSTSEPTSKSNTVFTLADGYMWKYMYTLSSANGNKFSTASYIPIDANSTIVAEAVPGSIETIVIETGGENYLGYNTGNVESVVNTTVVEISGSGAGSNGYYINSGFYVSGGTAQGNLAVVSNYVVNATGKWVTIDIPISVDTTSSYVISPQVKIVGDGQGALAYSTVNTSTGSVSNITMLATGNDYTWANVTIVANTSYGSGAGVVAILSPDGGHGCCPVTELGCEHLSITVDVANNETNTIPTEVEFRTMGILINPMANSSVVYSSNTFTALTTLTIMSATGSYLKNEKVTGQTSNASAMVAFANSTTLKISYTTGAFSNGETILGSNTAVTSTITDINTPDIVQYTGNVFYFDHVSEIQRSNTATETMKLIIKF